ncbi:TlpA family protein disulfide reductase [Halobacillus fulvus]|nr:TlpA family protein disulfide reductase [Halobacillus fulvus]
MVKRVFAALFLLALLAFGIYSGVTDGDKKQVANQSAENDGTTMYAPNSPAGLQAGEMAPDFTLKTLDGENVQLSDLKGKKVFVNFWATWCPPCREEMPEMQRFHEEFGDEVVVLAVNGTGSEKGANFENKMQVVKDYVEEGSYTFPVLLDEQLDITTEYQAISIPTTYFIGTDGTIQKPRRVGPMNYEFMIEMKNDLK